MKFAIVGCGRIAPNHIYAAKESGLEIVALCDAFPHAIDTLIDKCKGVDLSKTKRYSSYDELIKNEKIDIVAIATPSGSHAEIALALINAKINVIIEKPLALSIADANAIINAAIKNNVAATVCHQNRFNKSVQGVKKAMQAMQIEKIGYISAVVHWNRNENYYTQAPWRGTWENDGGCLMNQCIHNIDLLLWFIGDDTMEVKGHIANISHPYIDGEDVGSATILFKGGSVGIVDGTTMVYPENLEETLSIFAENATVKLGGKSVNNIETLRINGQTDETSNAYKNEYSDNPPNVYGYGHFPLYKDFTLAVLNHSKPAIALDDGKKAMEIILAVYKSAKTGANVKLPISDFSTLDMRGFFKNGI